MAPAPAKEWYGVEDPQKRKQIQNRLAQRARRKRLAEESKQDERSLVVRQRCQEAVNISFTNAGLPGAPTPRTGPGGLSPIVMLSDYSWDSGPSTTSSSGFSTATPSQPGSESTSPPTTDPIGEPISPPLAPDGTSTPLPTDHRLILKPNRTAFIAFAEIGHRMGISWCCVGLVRSWRQPPDLPENLQPTPLQLTTPHPVWIDRLPFPRMRDNVILLADNIDMAQFYVDLTLNESFEVKEDLPPHDPAAYRIVPAFKAKWGYLFH